MVKNIKRNLLMFISFGLVVFFLSGCFLSEEKALENAKEAAEKAFNEEPLETNQKIDQVQLHLPEDVQINGSSINNIFLEEDGQDYLLFYNQIEDEKSKHLFDGTKERPDSLLIESFEDENAFGYIAVFSTNNEDEYELQVGIGATKKISTLTTLDELEDKASHLMKILRSIQIEEEA